MPALVTQDLDLAADALRKGQLVAFGTETVYGLGANALDPTAVARIFEAKGRPTFDPLIVHIYDRQMVSRVASAVPPVAERLMARFWPGPLTLILPKRPEIPDLVTSGLSTVGVRLPDHPLAREFLRRADVPVAAPSANPFGGVSPTTAEHVRESLGDAIDVILDSGPCQVGLESTIVAVDSAGAVSVLRAGGVTIEDLEAAVGRVSVLTHLQEEGDRPLEAPGSFWKHYAPGKSLILFDDLAECPRGSEIGVMAFRDCPDADSFGAVSVLSREGSLSEAAAKFFAELRRLDASFVKKLYAQRFPERGLGLALNDRLRRASAR